MFCHKKTFYTIFCVCQGPAGLMCQGPASPRVTPPPGKDVYDSDVTMFIYGLCCCVFPPQGPASPRVTPPPGKDVYDSDGDEETEVREEMLGVIQQSESDSSKSIHSSLHSRASQSTLASTKKDSSGDSQPSNSQDDRGIGETLALAYVGFPMRI